MTRRLLGAFLAITVVVLAALLVPLGISHANREVDRVVDGIERDAVVIASRSLDDLQEGVLGDDVVTDVEAYSDETGARVVITDDEGIGLLDTDAPVPGRRDFSTRPEIATALGGSVARGTRSSATLGAGFAYAAVPVASGGRVYGAVRVTYPTSAVDAAVRRYWFTLVVVGVVTLGAVAATGVVVARWVTRPLSDLHDAALAFGQGDLAARAPVGNGPPEVRELASAFNRTASRVEELVTNQEAFVADASHELRTPLTALRLRLESLQSETSPEAADDLAAAIDETDRLGRLVEGLLALARADRAEPSLAAADLDVAAALAERAAVWDPLAVEGGVRLVTGASAGLVARATPDRLVQVLDNLVANALDHAPADTTVRLTGERMGTVVVLHVLDEGPGMTAEERERALHRFWRSGDARRRFGGSGLGLAIVDRLVRADGGEVVLAEAPGGGLDAQVHLPLGTRPGVAATS